VDRVPLIKGESRAIKAVLRTTPGQTLQITGTPTYELTDGTGTMVSSGNCDGWDTDTKQAPEAYAIVATEAMDPGAYDLLITLDVIDPNSVQQRVKVHCVVEVIHHPPWP
jgi:hypothetical protein